MFRLQKRCWAPLKEERPGFNEIAKVMQDEVADEVRRKEEQEIVVNELEDDDLYKARMGVEEHFEDGEEEAEGIPGMMRSEELESVRKNYDGVMRELTTVKEQLRESQVALALTGNGNTASLS